MVHNRFEENDTKSSENNKSPVSRLSPQTRNTIWRPLANSPYEKIREQVNRDKQNIQLSNEATAEHNVYETDKSSQLNQRATNTTMHPEGQSVELPSPTDSAYGSFMPSTDHTRKIQLVQSNHTENLTEVARQLELIQTNGLDSRDDSAEISLVNAHEYKSLSEGLPGASPHSGEQDDIQKKYGSEELNQIKQNLRDIILAVRMYDTKVREYIVNLNNNKKKLEICRKYKKAIISWNESSQSFKNVWRENKQNKDELNKHFTQIGESLKSLNDLYNSLKETRKAFDDANQQDQPASSTFDPMDRQLDPHPGEVLEQKTLEDFADAHPDHKLSILYKKIGKAIEEYGSFKFDINNKESKEIWIKRHNEMMQNGIKVYNLYINIKKQIKELVNSVQSHTSQSTSLNYQISYNNLFREVRRTCYSAVGEIQDKYLDKFYAKAVEKCEKVRKEYFEKTTATSNIEDGRFESWKNKLEKPLETMSNVIEDIREGIEILDHDRNARERLNNMEKYLRIYRDLYDCLSDKSIGVGKLYNSIKNNCSVLEKKWNDIMNIYNVEKSASASQTKYLKIIADELSKKYRDSLEKTLNDFEKPAYRSRLETL